MCTFQSENVPCLASYSYNDIIIIIILGMPAVSRSAAPPLLLASTSGLDSYATSWTGRADESVNGFSCFVRHPKLLGNPHNLFDGRQILRLRFGDSAYWCETQASQDLLYPHRLAPAAGADTNNLPISLDDA